MLIFRSIEPSTTRLETLITAQPVTVFYNYLLSPRPESPNRRPIGIHIGHQTVGCVSHFDQQLPQHIKAVFLRLVLFLPCGHAGRNTHRGFSFSNSWVFLSIAFTPPLSSSCFLRLDNRTIWSNNISFASQRFATFFPLSFRFPFLYRIFMPHGSRRYQVALLSHPESNHPPD